MTDALKSKTSKKAEKEMEEQAESISKLYSMPGMDMSAFGGEGETLILNASHPLVQYIADAFSPFLYPNQYVNFTADSKVVAKGQELAEGASSDLEVITRIYDYITQNITYDYDKASDPPTGYTSDVDAILASGTGICLDYAAVMASMLRSQRIPTRLEVGYAQDAYHAWISVYTADTGWLNGIIEFDGNVWTLVDPTFGANTDDKTLKKFIGDGSNYILQKMY